MAVKIKKRIPSPNIRSVPQTPLGTIFSELAEPITPVLGTDPVPAMMTWGMQVVAAAWNASRHPLELEGLKLLEAELPKLLTPAFQDEEELGRIAEAVFHQARTQHGTDPRYAMKLFVDRQGPGDYVIEVVPGLPRRKDSRKKR